MCGRISFVDFVVAHTLFRVICLYALNDVSERKFFFESLGWVFDTSARVILGGDFNCVTQAKDRQPRRNAVDPVEKC